MQRRGRSTSGSEGTRTAPNKTFRRMNIVIAMRISQSFYNLTGSPPSLCFSQVLILKEVKVVCFDTVLQVLILNLVSTRGLSRTVWVNEKNLGGAAPLSPVFAYEWQGKDLRDRECVRVANKGVTERHFCASAQDGTRETRLEMERVAGRVVRAVAASGPTLCKWRSG